MLKREDIAPGAAKVALTGHRCTEWPPLQVDPLSGVPTMEDRDTLGARIEQEGPFYKYFIAWPGNRLPVDDLREVKHGVALILLWSKSRTSSIKRGWFLVFVPTTVALAW